MPLFPYEASSEMNKLSIDSKLHVIAFKSNPCPLDGWMFELFIDAQSALWKDLQMLISLENMEALFITERITTA